MLKSSLLIFSFAFIQCVSQNAFAEASVKASVSLNPAGDFVATMKNVKGSATLAGGKISAKNVIIDLKTLTTGLELRDDHAKNKYLEVAKYPEAVLVEASGENGKGQGLLKFHGKEGPISGTYKVIDGKSVIAEFKIKLSAFGITEINYRGIGVEDDVKFEVQLPIVAALASATAPAAPAVKIPAKPTQPIKK